MNLRKGMGLNPFDLIAKDAFDRDEFKWLISHCVEHIVDSLADLLDDNRTLWTSDGADLAALWDSAKELIVREIESDLDEDQFNEVFDHITQQIREER